MAKIPFDIKYRPQIESGEYKVETRNGIPMDFVMRDEATTLLVFRNTKDKDLMVYREDGKWYNFQDENCTDLFLVTPEPELTEFEKACIELYQEGRDDGHFGDQLVDKALKARAAELLAIARKELMGGMLTSDPKETALYKAGLADGKAEALKDLPRWRKLNNIHEGLPYRSLVLYGMDDRKWEIADKGKQIGVLAMYIPIGDLKELPKDYNGELPGFKED